MRRWRVEDSAELYNINGWGRQYFSINDKGNVTVTPKEGVAPVDLRAVLDELQVKDITAPVLLRSPIFSTTVSKKYPTVSNLPPSNMVTKVRIS